jgi:hypothetical protein
MNARRDIGLEVNGTRRVLHLDPATQEGPEVALHLNSSVHAAQPDNLLRVILDGIQPSLPGHDEMPGFRDSLSDGQVDSLAAFIRQHFAPDSRPGRTCPAASRGCVGREKAFR